MNYIFVLSILVLGLSGLVAQVLLLRELLISFLGNELILGIILANWVIQEALGVFIIGKYIDRIKDKMSVFIMFQILFSLALPLMIYLSRTFKSMLGIPFGETLGLSTIFYASFLIILPVSFCHGALFSAGCKIYSLQTKESVSSIGKVYCLETIGTIIGGIISTYFFIPYLNSFQIVFIISLLNLALCLIISRYTSSRILKYITLLLLLSLFYWSSIGLNNTHNQSIDRQWQTQKVLAYRNSVYGNIVVTKKEEQYTFFYNGIPIITTPYPDITFVEEFGHLPLLFSSHPQDVLIIGSGAGGLINEILKHQIRKIDYAELDPLIIDTLKMYPSDLTQREMKDGRVKVINLDGRFFVRITANKYDVVLIGLSKPSDLSTNRLFTQDFFSLIKKRLNPDGILALWLPGSLTYLSKELRDLNACILNGLQGTYNYVRIIPGDYNIFLASASRDILEVNPALITQRINQRGIKANILTPSHLNYRLDYRWLEWFKHSSIGATRKVNLDFMPFAVFEMLAIWNKKFSPRLANLLVSLQNLDLRAISILIFLITLVFFYLFHQKPKLARLNIAYSIATTGFFGMLVNLILIFSFQILYGYLYYKIGILISIFMTGIAVGSIFMAAVLKRIKNALSLFIKLEIIIALFSYCLALTITTFGGRAYYSSLVFITLFFVAGLLMGLEFPLASKIYLTQKTNIGETVGLLYCADLAGGWLAGIFGGIIFLPILGLFNTCMVIVVFKLSSLLLLMAAKRDLLKESSEKV